MIDEGLLELATPEERAQYARLLEREVRLATPLDFACELRPGTKRWDHLVMLDEYLVALVEYRLYPDGPGPPPRWWYRLEEGGLPHEVAGPEDIPDNADEWWAAHPTTHVRVVFRLAIAMPPRHGKSYLVNENLAAWYLHRWPSRDVVLATYSDKFAEEWGVKFRDFVADHEDNLGFRMVKGRQSAADLQRVEKHGGSIRFVGAGGTLTGAGYQLGIIDDPFKSQEDALSEAERKRKHDWYESTWETRQTRKAGVVPVEVMMFTRWHEDDLTGRYVLDDENNARPGWCLIHLAALAEEGDPLGRKPGEALCPAVRTRASLEELQRTRPLWFAALYQGNPSHLAGTLFPADWPRYKHERGAYVLANGTEIPVADCYRFATVDVAATTKSYSDWSVCAVWDFHRETQQLFLVRVDRTRIESDTHYTWISKHAAADPRIKFFGIEDRTFGTTLIQTIRRRGGVRMRSMTADKDKLTRALPYVDAVKAMQVYLPVDASWVPEWIKEHSRFANGRWDDQVDCGAYAWEIVKDMPAKRPPKPPPTTAPEKIDAYIKRREKRAARTVGRGYRTIMHRQR